MSVNGRSERVGLLCAEIARIEAQGLPNNRLDAFQANPLAGRSSARFGNGLDNVLNGGLARGALHEILAASPGDEAAAAGFVLALAVRFAACHPGPIIWIGEDFAEREHGAFYGPGLALHGLTTGRLTLVHVPNAKEALWGFEEALKCRAPAVVIGEIWTLAKAYDLTASRRLLLAAQKGGTPGLLFAAGLPGSAEQFSSGAQTRFEIRAGPSPQLASAGGRMPLPGLASWSVRIAKARASPSGIDRGLFRPVLWDHAEASFRDAHPLSLATLSRDGSDHPAVGQKRARQRP
jgi:protein ImuA